MSYQALKSSTKQKKSPTFRLRTRSVLFSVYTSYWEMVFVYYIDVYKEKYKKLRNTRVCNRLP